MPSDSFNAFESTLTGSPYERGRGFRLPRPIAILPERYKRGAWLPPTFRQQERTWRSSGNQVRSGIAEFRAEVLGSADQLDAELRACARRTSFPQFPSSRAFGRIRNAHDDSLVCGRGGVGRLVHRIRTVRLIAPHHEAMSA